MKKELKYVKCRVYRPANQKPSMDAVSWRVDEIALFPYGTSEKDIQEQAWDVADIAYVIKRMPFTDAIYAKKVGMGLECCAGTNFAWSNCPAYSQDYVESNQPILLWDAKF